MRNARDSRQRPDYTCAFSAHGVLRKILSLMLRGVIKLFLAQATEADGDYIRALKPESPFIFYLVYVHV